MLPRRSDSYTGNLIQVPESKSVSEEVHASNRATMESAALAIDGSLNNSDGFSVEQDVNGLKLKETAFQEIVAQRHEPTVYESLPDNSCTMETMSCSAVSENKYESGERDVQKHEKGQGIVDEPVGSDLELIRNRKMSEKDGDDPCLPLSVTTSDNQALDQSPQDNNVMAISSSLPEASVCGSSMCDASTGNDVTATIVKVKTSLLDGSLDSVFNEETTTVASEQLEDISGGPSGETVAQEHEKEECVQSHDSASVLSVIENVASLNEPAPDKSVDQCSQGDVTVLLNVGPNPEEAAAASESVKIVVEEHEKEECLQTRDPIPVLSTSVDDLAVDKSEDHCRIEDKMEPGKETNMLDEVIVAKAGFSAVEILHDMSSTLKTFEKLEAKLIPDFIGDKTVEENPNQQKSRDSAEDESSVPKPEVTLVESHFSKVHSDIEHRGSAVDKVVGVTPGPVDNQSLDVITSSTGFTFKTENVAVDPDPTGSKNPGDERFDSKAVGEASTSNEALNPESGKIEIETGLSVEVSGTSTVLEQDDEEKATLHTFEEQIACKEGSEQKFEIESSEKTTAEVQAYGIVEVVSSVEVASETFNILEAVPSNGESLELIEGANARTKNDEAEGMTADMEVDLDVSTAKYNETTGSADARITENEAKKRDTDMEVDLAGLQNTELKDSQLDTSEVETDSKEDDQSGGAAQHLKEKTSTFSILGSEDVDAPIPAGESENPSGNITEAGEDRKASKSAGLDTYSGLEQSARAEAVLESSTIEDVISLTGGEEPKDRSDKETEGEAINACNLDEASVPASEFCEPGSKCTSVDVLAGSVLSSENEGPPKDSLAEDVVSPTSMKESENQSDKESREGEYPKACDLDKASVSAALEDSLIEDVVPPTQIKESESQSDKETGEDQKACNPVEASVSAPPTDFLVEDVAAPTPMEEPENQFDKGTGGDDLESCCPHETTVSAPNEVSESGSKATGMEVLAGSAISVEEEKSSPVEDLVALTPATVPENQSDKEIGEDKEVCNEDEASVPTLCELESKDSGLEVERCSERSFEVEAPLDDSLVEDVKECENQADHETEVGNERVSSPNETPVPASECCMPGSEAAAVETTAGLEQCVEKEGPSLQKSIPVAETEKSENESSQGGNVPEAHLSEDAELERTAVSVTEFKEPLEPAISIGMSEENTDIEQAGGDDSKNARDVEVTQAVSQTTDTEVVGRDSMEVATDIEVDPAFYQTTDTKDDLGRDSPMVATDVEVTPAFSQIPDTEDDLPSSLIDSSKATETHESPSQAPGAEEGCPVEKENEEKPMETE